MSPRDERRVAFHSFGCRVNYQDLDELVHRARLRGWREVGPSEEAEVHVLNTCTVTQAAEGQARKLIRKIRRRQPGCRVVVTGCYAEVDPEAVRALPGVDLVVGNLEKQQVLEWVEELEQGQRDPDQGFRPVSRARTLDTPLREGAALRVRPVLKVQDGCNHRCSFCIIPRARGPSRSLPLERVLEQLRLYGEAGVPEVILSGVHIAGYGRDLPGSGDLEFLLGQLAEAPGLPRLRLSSIEPVDLTTGSVELLAEHPERFCRALHMAAQSGSDRILEAMGRRYTRNSFLERAEQIVARIPGVGIGLDLLVGFPGEDPEAFQETLDLVRRLPVASVHAFPYSERPGTRAASLPGSVPPSQRKDRVRILQDLARIKGRAFRQTQAGEPLEAVAVRRVVDRGLASLQCVTDNALEVLVPASETLDRGDRLVLRFDDPEVLPTRGRPLEVLQRASRSVSLAV